MTFHTVDRKNRRLVRSLTWAGLLIAAATVAAVGGSSPAFLGGGLGLLAAVLVIGHAWMKDEGGVPVLVYHSVSDDPRWLPWADDIAVSPATFDRHLGMLVRAGFSVIPTSELVAARRSGRPLPPRPVAIHLDDGYLDNWVAAVPILRRHGLPATIFVSLDFIENGNAARPTIDDVAAARLPPSALPWRGYLNWQELQAIQKTGLVEIQPHGVDHGRVAVGPRVVARLTPENWRRLAWVQWAAVAGGKADWHLWPAPPALPFGTPVHESRPALAARAWLPEGFESEQAYVARVRDHLLRARQVLESRLGHRVHVFCWPENGTSDAARRIAEEVGYLATTAGRGENRAEEDPRVISRLHVGERVLGWHWPAADVVALYAAIRVFQGNYYWFFLLLLFAALRRLHAVTVAGRRSRR